MVLRSTFDLRVPRGTRAARISAHFASWSFTRTSGATTDLLLVSGPTALLIDVFVNRCVSCSHARPPYDHRASPRHRTTARGVSRTTLSKWEAARSGVRLERLSVVLQPHAVNQGAKRTGSGGGRQGSVLDRLAGSRGSHRAARPSCALDTRPARQCVAGLLARLPRFFACIHC